MYTDAVKVGIIGASGYAGVELLRLLAGHPELDLVVATAHSQAGRVVAEHTPSLAGA
jgi:N-acetyl-gamma-glutamyl-phosphate reductase